MCRLLREDPPKKSKVSANGAILLNKNDPYDKEWYENDEAIKIFPRAIYSVIFRGFFKIFCYHENSRLCLVYRRD